MPQTPRNVAACGVTLRLDKFMKVSRLAKRRSEAHEALVNGRITLVARASGPDPGGSLLKPGYDVKAGDVITLHYATRFVTVRVLLVPEKVTPALRTTPMYEVLEERREEQADWLS